jgi:hypothetical protein
VHFFVLIFILHFRNHGSNRPMTEFNFLTAISTLPEVIAPAVLVIMSRHGPHREHRSSIVPFVSVAVGTCLPSCCPEMAVVCSPISQLLRSNGCRRYNVFYFKWKRHWRLLLSVTSCNTVHSHRYLATFCEACCFSDLLWRWRQWVLKKRWYLWDYLASPPRVPETHAIKELNIEGGGLNTAEDDIMLYLSILLH